MVLDVLRTRRAGAWALAILAGMGVVLGVNARRTGVLITPGSPVPGIYMPAGEGPEHHAQHMQIHADGTWVYVAHPNGRRLARWTGSWRSGNDDMTLENAAFGGTGHWWAGGLEIHWPFEALPIERPVWVGRLDIQCLAPAPMPAPRRFTPGRLPDGTWMLTYTWVAPLGPGARGSQGTTPLQRLLAEHSSGGTP